MAGNFPKDFPPLAGLDFLNVSFNKLTGMVKPMEVKKFGRSAFIKAGSLNFSSSTPAAGGPTSSSRGKKRRSKSHEGALRLGVTIAAASLVAISLLACVLYAMMRRRKRKGRKDERKGEDPAAAAPAVPASVGKETGWVAEARWAAPVVVFEKPLMEMTFADLAAATSRFGRESQLSEGGRRGPAFRAVLPGDMHVVVRVLEAARKMDEQEAPDRRLRCGSRRRGHGGWGRVQLRSGVDGAGNGEGGVVGGGGGMGQETGEGWAGSGGGGPEAEGMAEVGEGGGGVPPGGVSLHRRVIGEAAGAHQRRAPSRRRHLIVLVFFSLKKARRYNSG